MSEELLHLIFGKCAYCDKSPVAKVGFGPNPILVCQEHLDEWLDVDV